jgi:Tfp pilus assembly protein PilV
MMASVILMVGFMGMISVMTVSSGMMDHARRQTLADQILTHEIEELRLATWTTISALPTNSTSVALDSQFSAAVAASGATYTVTRTVTSPNPYPNIREVNFTVTWVVATSRRDASNNPLTFTYQRTNTAWFGQYGLNLTYQRS